MFELVLTKGAEELTALFFIYLWCNICMNDTDIMPPLRKENYEFKRSHSHLRGMFSIGVILYSF